MKRNNSTPKRKTSVYLDEENIEKIKGFKVKYNLSLNRTVNYVSHEVSSRDASLDLREKNEKNSRRRMGISSR